MSIVKWTCYHCLEDFAVPAGWRWECCPACEVAGHNVDDCDPRRCEACNREFV